MQTHPPKMFLHLCKMSAFNYCLSESTNIMSQAGSLWHKAHLHCHLFQSDQRYDANNLQCFQLLCFSFQTMTAGDVVCTRVYDREWENVFKASSDINSNSLYLFNKHTLTHLAFLFLRIAMLVRTWQHHALCWRGWKRRMLEQLSLICSIHTVWKPNSVYKNLTFHFKKQKQYCF